MKKLAFLSLLTFAALLSSCSSDDDPINPPNDVTYAGTVKAIIDGSCISCHANPPVNGAPMSLITLDDVKNAITGRGLISRIENGSMPPGTLPDLTTAQIQAIKDWQTGGFQ